MAYVTITKDLTQVKSKVVFGLTRRQLLFFALAALVAVPIYFLTRRSLGTDIALMLLIVTALPFFFLALYEKKRTTAGKASAELSPRPCIHAGRASVSDTKPICRAGAADISSGGDAACFKFPCCQGRQRKRPWAGTAIW